MTITPRVALVLGSGLGALADDVENATRTPYAEIDGFPVSTVPGHAGQLVVGELAGTPVAIMQGRFHLYEGIDPSVIPVPIQYLKGLGCETIILTNAAGSLNLAARPGELMLITDHINLTAMNPLTGPQFIPMGGAYDLDLRNGLRDMAGELGIRLHEGVYIAVRGPSFETPAEIHAFRTLGADAVGMSTVLEVIAARHAGLKVAAISAITNMAEGLSDELLSHEHTLDNAKTAAEDLIKLLTAFVEKL